VIDLTLATLNIGHNTIRLLTSSVCFVDTFLAF
jgi:hypothetical protein